METVERPWGTFRVIHESPTCKLKQICVKPKARLSYQSHQHRREVWFVQFGTATVLLDGVTHIVEVGQKIFIPQGAKHRLGNGSAVSWLIITELQEGESFEESDIVRYEDDHGREVTKS